jgi:hypothetical protein
LNNDSLVDVLRQHGGLIFKGHSVHLYT